MGVFMAAKKRKRVGWTLDEDTISLIKHARLNSPSTKTDGQIVDWAISKLFKTRKHAILERIVHTKKELAWWIRDLKEYLDTHPEELDSVAAAILKDNGYKLDEGEEKDV